MLRNHSSELEVTYCLQANTQPTLLSFRPLLVIFDHRSGGLIFGVKNVMLLGDFIAEDFQNNPEMLMDFRGITYNSQMDL